ncbi:MAG: hypothetical protein U5R31_03045 [Acidimicrobiia bacterium]|nr:hypothetical protein [Acidimicrobiia bacterium]
MQIVFAHNPTGWGDDGAPIPGGMSDAHIEPVRRQLVPGSYVEVDSPMSGEVVNVYYTHRRNYGANRERGWRSVFAGHGLADKAWRNAGRVRDYDFVVTSGPAWTQRLVTGGYPGAHLLEVGYPKLDPIFNGEIDSPWPERDGRIRVLWAPTHGGGGERYRRSSTPPATAGARRTMHWRRDEVIDALPESECVVMAAPHPRHRSDGRSTLAEYVGADVVIADGGSTIYEAWALGLPVVFASWITAEAHLTRRVTSFEADIYRHQVGRHAGSAEELPGLVASAAGAGISEVEAMFIEPILPASLRGRGAMLLADALTAIAGGHAPHHDSKLKFRHRGDGKVVEVAAVSPRARRFRLSDRWELV